jgi:hypothetical protein
VSDDRKRLLEALDRWDKIAALVKPHHVEIAVNVSLPPELDSRETDAIVIELQTALHEAICRHWGKSGDGPKQIVVRRLDL